MKNLEIPGEITEGILKGIADGMPKHRKFNVQNESLKESRAVSQIDMEESLKDT